MKHLAHIAKEAKKHDIPVLSEEFISASISKRKLLNMDDFAVSVRRFGSPNLSFHSPQSTGKSDPKGQEWRRKRQQSNETKALFFG
jgi:hypothetical protein